MKVRNKGKRINGYPADYIVFDLETTGVSPEMDDIIEISALKVCGHKVTEEFSTLVNPGRHIPAGATAVNGITDEMVKDAPDIKTALEKFIEFIGDGVLVGHNIHTFDTNFIYDAAWDAFGKGISNDYIDTLHMARRCLPELSHHRLTDIAEHFQIATEGAHRALADCLMNQKCFEELGKLQKSVKGEELTCPKCGGVLVKRRGRYGEFYGCEEFPRCRFTQNIRPV